MRCATAPSVVCAALRPRRKSASLNVEYELSQRGWTWRHDDRPGSRWSQPGVGRVILVHKDGRSVEAEGMSLKEALCRAAVKAVST